MTKAAGFLEAEGYVSIFKAVDAMAKATDVDITGVVKLGGGLVAVAVSGDLATVEEAIAVGEAAANREGRPPSKSIIFANPCDAVADIAADPKNLAAG